MPIMQKGKHVNGDEEERDMDEWRESLRVGCPRQGSRRQGQPETAGQAGVHNSREKWGKDGVNFLHEEGGHPPLRSKGGAERDLKVWKGLKLWENEQKNPGELWRG